MRFINGSNRSHRTPRPRQLSSWVESAGRGRTSQQVRGKFFQKLGILRPKLPSISAGERSVRDLRDVPQWNEPLRYNQAEERMGEERRRPRRGEKQSTSTGRAGKPSPAAPGGSSRASKRQVGFEEVVAVVPVPTRSDYPDRIRSKLWGDKEDRIESVERNLLEFAAEGRDWRRACQEEEMYVCGVTGDLIHPVHVATQQYVFGSPGDSRRESLPDY